MKKTINVTIGGLVFNIEEDGYQKLNNYLESLKSHFSTLSYGSEVIADIESRIAEQFNAKTSGNAQRAVALADVEDVLKSIGSLEDFGGSENSAKSAEPVPAKKLYRNMDDVIIAGVGSGLAEYFGIDTTLVRVILAVTVLAGGWGILLYILLWLILPEAKTVGQKLEMKGSPVTIKQIEQTAKEKISEVKASNAGRNIGNFIGKVIKIFVRIILAIIGASLAFAGAVAAFAVTFSVANLIFNRNSPYIDFPIASVFHGSEYFFAVLLAFVTVVIPMMYLTLGGLTLIRMKRPGINPMLATGLSIIWVAAAIGTSVFAFNKLPAIQSALHEYQGQVETRTIQASDFTKVDASSAYSVNVVPGKVYAITVTGHSRDLDLSQINVENATLTLDRKARFCLFCFDNSVTVDITTPNLDSIKGSGAVTYTVGSFKSNSFDVDLSGASRASVESISSTDATVSLSGASSATIAGSTKTLKLDLSGASRFNGFDLSADDVRADVSGASHVDIQAVKTLDAEASGASTIIYRGNPQLTRQDESGASHIRPE